MFASEPGCGTKQPPLPGRGKSSLVAIVTAIPEEFHAIVPRVSQAERRRTGKGHRGFLLKGRMAGVPALLAMAGDGAARASGSVSFLLGEFSVSFLVGAGAAGALVPSLQAGEILVASRAVDEQGDAPPPDSGLLSSAVACGARPATFVTVARPVCSATEKRDLAVRLAASDSSPAVVDMESAAWARAAASRGVPYMLLRAVSDTFEEELPAFLASCLSPEGSVNRSTVARRLILRPAALPVLLRMRRRVRDGAGALALFLERLLPEMI